MTMLLLYCLEMLYNVVITNSGNTRGLLYILMLPLYCLAMSYYNVVITNSANKRGLYANVAFVLPCNVVLQSCNY
jgi:hypothetical protein